MDYDHQRSSEGEYRRDQEPITTGQFLLLFLLFFLPIINFILIPKWAFGKKGNLNRRNYARACMVLYGFGVIIEIIVFLYMTRIDGH